MEAIFLKPYLQEKIWGGNKLKTVFGLEIPSENTGEAWMISAHPNGASTIIYPENFKGQTLQELYRNEKELFGPNCPEVFPLLIKIIDAKEALSVQVHPNDAYASANEGPSELGKTECWYIISADEDAKIIYGHHAKNVEEFDEFVQSGKFEEVFTEIPVKAGDFFDVPAGTIHAIGGGITILETQQNSDTTYRVYDYNRIDKDGNKRELHIEKAKDVTLFPHVDSPYTQQNLQIEKNQCVKLLSNEYFDVYKYEIDQEVTSNLSDNYHLLTVISGNGTLELDNQVYDLKIADSLILPYGKKEIALSGNMEIIMSTPNK